MKNVSELEGQFASGEGGQKHRKRERKGRKKEKTEV